MFCLYTFLLARPAQAKIQNLTAICCIVKLIPWNVVNLSHLYVKQKNVSETKHLAQIIYQIALLNFISTIYLALETLVATILKSIYFLGGMFTPLRNCLAQGWPCFRRGRWALHHLLRRKASQLCQERFRVRLFHSTFQYWPMAWRKTW